MATEVQTGTPAPAPETRVVIYVGGEPTLIEAALAPLGTGVSVKSEPQVAGALMAAARLRAHAVIVDLTRPDDARKLLVAALAAAKHPPRVIVIGRREDVGEHLRMPGVYCVIAYPLLPAQIRAAVADRRAARRNGSAPQEPPAGAAAPPAPVPETALKSPEVAEQQKRWPGFRLYMIGAGRFMTAVSNLYKNAAFVLLASLFAAFTFYGFLIAYFLLASGWGAPMTLTRGHQLVEKAVNDLGELRVTLNLNVQRRSEAELDARKAKSAYDDARVLVDFMGSTIDSEIATRLKNAGAARRNLARMERVLKDYNGQGGAKAQRADALDLYRKRLITRRSYDAQVLGSLEASQRVSGLETEIDAARSDIDRLVSSVDLLQTLRLELAGNRTGKVVTGNTELLPLTKEVVDARSGLDQAISQLESANERLKLLDQSTAMLGQRIAEIEQGPLGRAAKGRVDVIFVPYGNERSFTPGTKLYTCALTVIVCHRAGTIGAAIPGESTAVHPFFGKPIRGFFVEARLDDPDAASQEIIHAARPPFFL